MRALRDRRRSQRGQIIPVAALMMVVLLSATAIAVDLSIQTNTRRALQNTTDAGALAGARNLPSNTSNAVSDALLAIQTNLSLPPGWDGASPVKVCGTGNCANITYTTSGVTYVVQVNAPPKVTSTSTFRDKSHIEVIIQRTSSTFVAGAMGFSSATQGATSIAVHVGPNLPFNFALYSQTFELDGNQGETIAGDVYAGQYINPQSKGLADFCAGLDSNGNGTIFLGAPQYAGIGSPTGTEQYGQSPGGADPDTFHQVSDCSLVAGKSLVAQVAPLGCPSGITGLTGFSLSYDINFTQGCIITPGLAPPNMPAPTNGTFITLDGTLKSAPKTLLSVTGPLVPAVYVVIHNPNCSVKSSCFDVDFSGAAASGTYTATFWLQNGATIGVRKGANVTITPYVPPKPSSNDGKFIIYSDPPPDASTPSLTETDLATSLTLGTPGAGGGCSGAHTGTVYLPNGSVNVTSNALLSITGQAVVNSWNVQSGNHTNPSLTFSGCNNATTAEELQLVH